MKDTENKERRLNPPETYRMKEKKWALLPKEESKHERNHLEGENI